MPNNNKFHILIVDDSEFNREMLSDMLSERYEITEAENGEKAISILEQSPQKYALVLLDIIMPKLDGFGVLAYMNKNHWSDNIPVIMISTENSPSAIKRAYQLGATDFVNRPFNVDIIRQRVQNTILLYAKQRKMSSIVADQIYKKQKNTNIMVSILSHIVEFRNGESGMHVLHIQTFAEIILKHLMTRTDRYPLTAEDISLIITASALHDIGKISIPDSIINKPGRLTKEEFEIMKTHAAIGAQMLSNLSFYGDEKLLQYAHDICRWHHERYDGKGYPDGLVGDEIPISAQVVSLADVYDALTSDRCYKKAFSHETSIQMILNGECGTFNPLLLECLVDVSEQLRYETEVMLKKEHNRDLQAVRRELEQYDETSASGLKLRQMETEHIKFDFLVSEIPDLVFSYIRETDVFTLSQKYARLLHLNDVILNPRQNERFCALFGKNFIDDLMIKAECTSKEKADFTDTVTQISRFDFIRTTYTIRCKALWLADYPQCCGVVGRITEEKHYDNP